MPGEGESVFLKAVASSRQTVLQLASYPCMLWAMQMGLSRLFLKSRYETGGGWREWIWEELGVILLKYIVFMCSSQRISKKIINRFYIYLVCVCVLDFG